MTTSRNTWQNGVRAEDCGQTRERGGLDDREWQMDGGTQGGR